MRAALVVLIAGAAGANQQGVTWLKPEQGKALSARTGIPVLIYVACDPVSGKASCGNSPADRAFGEAAIEKRKDSFHFVRVLEKKMAQDIKATRCPEVIFQDCDGDEFSRSSFQDARTLDRAMEQALQKYSPREIAWSAFDSKKGPVSDDSRRLVLLAFVDERKESAEALKVLEDRQLAKYHDRFVFMKVAFRRDSEESRKWGVALAPSLVIVDPAKGEALERTSGRRTVKELKPLLVKALGRLEKK